jgi:subtilisin family serine protease
MQHPANRPLLFHLARLLPILLAALSLSGMSVEPDASKIDPLLGSADARALADIQREVLGAAVRESVSIPAFLLLSEEDEDLFRKIGAIGGDAQRVHPHLLIAHLPANALRYVSNWQNVAYIEAPRNARPLLNRSRPAVSADVVQTPGTFSPPFDSGITGAGAFVGVVDTGLSVAHPDFRTDGTDTSLRVAHWYPNQATASVDIDGHGTHVTGIAAGNGFASGGLYTGMAPGSEILVGKAGDNAFPTDIVIIATGDLISFAESQSRPVAVNLSLGTSLGPHDGTSAFESGINALATGPTGSRRIITAAAGNGGTGVGHFGGSVDTAFGSATASLTFKQTAPPIEVQVWADGEDRYTTTVTLTTNAGNLIDSVSVPSGSAASSQDSRITVFNRTAFPPNGATFIVILFSPPASGVRGTVRLDRTRNGGSGRIDAYVNESEGTFAVPTPSGTITEPANADNVLAAGSFNTRQPADGAISLFSSRGPTRDGRLKPDLTAPGRSLFSTRSFEAPAGNYDGIVPGNDNYAVLTGTSMSAPHVAGIAALAWESSPSLTGAQMRERLRKTADPVSPTLTWGFGKVNALSAVTAAVAAITAPETARPGEAVTLTSGNSSAPFGGTITGYTWSSLADSGVSLAPGPDGSSAEFTATAPGIYTVSLDIQTAPSGSPSIGDSAVIHVNNVPVAAVSGPAPDVAGIPVTFIGSGTDADNQDLTFRWVLVDRPGASEVSSLDINGSQAVLAPDVEGIYTVGLRVDDGLDNSVLATSTYTTFGALPRRTGGGGCSLPVAAPGEAALSAAVSFLLLASPILALAIRKRMRRIRK